MSDTESTTEPYVGSDMEKKNEQENIDLIVNEDTPVEMPTLFTTEQLKSLSCLLASSLVPQINNAGAANAARMADEMQSGSSTNVIAEHHSYSKNSARPIGSHGYDENNKNKHPRPKGSKGKHPKRKIEVLGKGKNKKRKIDSETEMSVYADSDFENRVKNLGNKNESEDTSDSDDGFCLDSIREGYLADDETGPAGQDDLAALFSDMKTKPLSKEKIVAKIKEHTRPENVTLETAQVNPEIWSNIISTQDRSLYL